MADKAWLKAAISKQHFPLKRFTVKRLQRFNRDVISMIFLVSLRIADMPLRHIQLEQFSANNDTGHIYAKVFRHVSNCARWRNQGTR
ncbi:MULTISPECIES: hypothetical protein [unclassified Caballeronia]|uniref:hypothetical protein n=1 Tax=unclassified Caballeronia TaxID=2646786 RepID=UPI0028583C61|nr:MULTISPECIES: hypothetical protein [unclassified Caballeronia]MDR5774376.1 hypothetical protein [Caballeronia sp. LZ002]MDR5849811.1 hypothetical protein [Caballeronia sp. LZ003]